MNASQESQRGPFVWTLALLTWVGFALLAVTGGIIRVTLMEPRLGAHLANMIETLGLTVVLAGAIWVAVPWLAPDLRERDLRRLGIFWVALTLAFEFLFGHFVDGADWSALLSNYDVTAGRLWILVPLTMWLGPMLVGKLRAAGSRQAFHQRPTPIAAPRASRPDAARQR
jgi:hypothetical protein